ncbi:MAG: D-aminoacyl-tRNA deacylase [Thermoplasmata archaeon]
MRLIVSSKEDKASMNILDKLLDHDWNEIGEYRGNPVYQKETDMIVTVNEHHIYVDNIDKEVEDIFEFDIDHVVFISKHASKAGIHSLTVHPIGNYGEAKFGGIEGRLVPPAPESMTKALRVLWKKARETGMISEYEVSFEATHHGPYLEKPTYYIEIGSDESCWQDDRAGSVIADTVMSVEKTENKPNLVGIGGGHYAPAFTDISRHHEVNMGHMVPGWAVKSLNKDNLADAVELSDADHVILDDGLKGSKRKKVLEILEELNVEIITEKEISERYD